MSAARWPTRKTRVLLDRGRTQRRRCERLQHFPNGLEHDTSHQGQRTGSALTKDGDEDGDEDEDGDGDEDGDEDWRRRRRARGEGCTHRSHRQEQTEQAFQ